MCSSRLAIKKLEDYERRILQIEVWALKVGIALIELRREGEEMQRVRLQGIGETLEWVDAIEETACRIVEELQKDLELEKKQPEGASNV